MPLTDASVGRPAQYEPPPLYRIRATSLFDAGLQQGRMAGTRIRGWLSTPEMKGLRNYTDRDGAAGFAQLKRDNAATFPQLVRELEGVASGAGVPPDDIWRATMINELESLRSTAPGAWHAGHCSDVYAVPPGGYSAGFAHGHNEDWPGPIWQYWYFVAYSAAPGADFASCAGAVYPGGLLGWAASWNARGLYLTQNSLFPKRNLPGGLSSAFVQRAALCGAGGGEAAAGSLDELVGALSTPRGGLGWSSAASLNLVSLVERRMANLEVHLDKHARREVREEEVAGEGRSGGGGAAGAANYSHFNAFKSLEVGVADDPEPSSRHRQARVDALPPVRSAADIRSRLSDARDEAFPIYRNMTLHTLVLDGPTGRLDVWCCGRSAAHGPPVYQWELLPSSPFFGFAERLPARARAASAEPRAAVTAYAV